VTRPAERATVVCDDARIEAADSPLDLDRWRRLAQCVLEDEGVLGELTLTFIDVADIAALNAEHMGVEGPTDVLSFPLDSDSQPCVPTLLGDVVISPEVAAAQYATHAGTLDDELALLVVHGTLHVLGYDHRDESEGAAMWARQLELLVQHHWRGSAPSGFRQLHD
jgi:probable rRNA maturation factor